MPPEPILFTYDYSPNGRKIDYYLALRGIKYYHCTQPSYLPRPDLESLGIKYRRIPILALGRDVYCDTRVIIEKLEQLYPDNRLANSTDPASKGLARLFEIATIDGGMSRQTAMLTPSTTAIVQDQKWQADRAELTGFKFSPELLKVVRPDGLVHVRTFFDMMETTFLADGRKFVLGTDTPSLADVQASWTFDWTLQESLDMIQNLEKDVVSEKLYPKTFAWVQRIRDVVEEGYEKTGRPVEVGIEEVRRKMANAGFVDKEGEVDEVDPLKLRKGQTVEIWPSDTGFNHKDRGQLVSISLREVVIESKMKDEDETLRLHYPRTNFKIKPVS